MIENRLAVISRAQEAIKAGLGTEGYSHPRIVFNGEVPRYPPFRYFHPSEVPLAQQPKNKLSKSVRNWERKDLNARYWWKKHGKAWAPLIQEFKELGMWR